MLDKLNGFKTVAGLIAYFVSKQLPDVPEEQIVQFIQATLEWIGMLLMIVGLVHKGLKERVGSR